MDQEAYMAMMKFTARKAAPGISDQFEHIAELTGESKYNFNMILGYKHNGDFDDITNHTIVWKNNVTGTRVNTKTSGQGAAAGEFQLSDLFPILSNLFKNCAEDWDTTPWHIVLRVRLKASSDPLKKDYIDMMVREKNRIDDPGYQPKEFAIV